MNSRKSVGFLVIACLVASQPAHALVFNFIHPVDIDPFALAGFETAGARWASRFCDNVTVNVEIGFEDLPSGVLGSTSSEFFTGPYAGIRDALIADAKSALDDVAVANLPAGPTVPILFNLSKEQTEAPFFADPFDIFLTDMGSMNLTSANAKALGLAAPYGPTDATVKFDNADFDWDFDTSNGFDGPTYLDFVGVAEHELGHVLGFVSQVDTIDFLAFAHLVDPGSFPTFPSLAAGDYNPNPLDLYRWSADSVGVPALDMVADDFPKYFSVDGGVTPIAPFSLGTFFGDGRQASHWLDDALPPFAYTGVMDPTLPANFIPVTTGFDIMAFDAIGWDVCIPEPTSLAILLVSGTGLWFRRRRAV